MNYTKITAFLALTLGLIWLSIFVGNMLNISEMGMIATGDISFMGTRFGCYHRSKVGISRTIK